MNPDQAAKCFAQLGHPTRLEIFRLLVKSGPEGLAVGEIQHYLSIPGSTLSHHIAHLGQAGLIRQERAGRVLRCYPNFEQMKSIIAYMQEECCVGVCLEETLESTG